MDLGSGGVRALETVKDRDSVVTMTLATKLDQFTTTQTFSVFAGTYNVNGQSPDGHLRDWLAVDKEPPDIYVIGFQVVPKCQCTV